MLRRWTRPPRDSPPRPSPLLPLDSEFEDSQEDPSDEEALDTQIRMLYTSVARQRAMYKAALAAENAARISY